MKLTTAAPDEGHLLGHANFESLAAFAIAGSHFGVCHQEMHMRISNELRRDHIAWRAIIEEIEGRLEREFGKVTATIHVEPLP